MPKLKLKNKAPDFTLPDQDGKEHTLSDFRGRWVLIYFYPKDDTPGCTKEACVIRDAFPNFKKLKAVVLGISTDSVKSHQKFAAKYGLPFTLLEKEGVKGLRRIWQEEIHGQGIPGDVPHIVSGEPQGSCCQDL